MCYLSTPSKSHVLLALPLCEELAARGHQVLTVTKYKFGKETSNFTNVVVPVEGLASEMKAFMASGVSTESFMFMKLATEHFRQVSIETLVSPEVQKIMDEDKFDLVIFLSALVNNVQIGIADHFKAPWVALTPMGNMLPNRQLIGSHTLPATVPNQMSGIRGTMSFKERVINFLFNVVDYLISFYINYITRSDYETYFPAEKYRSYDEMKKNIYLLFMNSHFSDTGVNRPLLPNEIEVGGIQIKTKPAPLTGELKKFLDEASDGAILWTFGSNVEVSTSEPEKVDIMLKVLSKLNQRVVLKWEIENTSRLPNNIFAQKWLPQDAILAHPNIKLFIGHGGSGGVGEAKYYKVPILAMPFFGDQETNAMKIEAEEWGRCFKLSNVTEESFSEVLNDLLTNQK